MYFKLYPLQEVQGVFWGLSQAQANAWIHRLIPVLQQALGYEKALPQRKPRDLDEVLCACASLEFFLDGTERGIARPQDPDRQKQNYSGKKKCHTRKNLLISDRQCYVHYLSPTGEGKKHDKKIADEEDYRFPQGSTLYQDTGFQGYEPGTVVAPDAVPDVVPDAVPDVVPDAVPDVVPDAVPDVVPDAVPVQVKQPKKKPRGQDNPLSAAEKETNRQISAVRIRVEHAIGGVKRCRIVKDVLRNTREKFDDLVMETACGLHNFRLSKRAPQHAE